MNETDQALQHLRAEIERARKKHPGNAMLFPALLEELGEASVSCQSGEEWIHVACVAMRLHIEGSLRAHDESELEDIVAALGHLARKHLRRNGVPD